MTTKWPVHIRTFMGTFLCCWAASFCFSLVAQLITDLPMAASAVKITAATTVLVTVSMLMLNAAFTISMGSSSKVDRGCGIAHRTDEEEPARLIWPDLPAPAHQPTPEKEAA